MEIIELLKALLLGIVEGITEWLPISSTGHMILVDEFVTLNVSKQFLELFLVVIQLGAIMAVVVIYFHKLNPLSPRKTASEKKATWRLWGMVAIGCIPAAIIGVTLDDFFNEHFYNAWTVAVALIVYGVIFIIIERKNRKEEEFFIKHHTSHAKLRLHKIETVDEMDIITSLKIGAFQCLAIVPGTSRSGSTIIGGMISGCSRVAATEYTFFLAIPVMLGWGLLKTLKMILSGVGMTATEIGVLIVGVLSAFVVSIVAIKFLLKYIKSHDFSAFGIYRIVVGIIVLAYFGVKTLL
jgi:undecaprenyl-diphosphatase